MPIWPQDLNVFNPYFQVLAVQFPAVRECFIMDNQPTPPNLLLSPRNNALWSSSLNKAFLNLYSAFGGLGWPVMILGWYLTQSTSPRPTPQMVPCRGSHAQTFPQVGINQNPPQAARIQSWCIWVDVAESVAKLQLGVAKPSKNMHHTNWLNQFHRKMAIKNGKHSTKNVWKQHQVRLWKMNSKTFEYDVGFK